MRLYDQIMDKYYHDWIKAKCPIPLEVSRSRYDDITVSWEVFFTVETYYPDLDWTGSCGYPIAEFTTWREAQDWATSITGRATDDPTH